MPEIDQHGTSMLYDTTALAAWSGGAWHGCPPATVSGFIHDTRLLKPGCMFVALRGEKRDGHAHVADAAAAGAAAALVATAWTGPDGGLPLLRVEDPLRALGRMAAGWRRQSRARIIGITGSCGKTTIKELVCALLRLSFRVYGSPGNWNNAIGVPLSLLGMPPRTAVGVFEIGTNHPGEIDALCRIAQPDIGVVSGIGPAHIGHFGSLEAIAHEKGALIRSLPLHGVAILNREDSFFATLRAQARCQTVSFSLGGVDADVRGNFENAANGRLRITCDEWPEGIVVSPAHPGDYPARNVLAAVAVARALSVPAARMDGDWPIGIGAPMRWQVDSAGPFPVINDAYNANPMSMRSALEAFLRMPGTVAKKIPVLGDMRELGRHAEREHRALGAWLARFPWRLVILVGPDSRWTAAGASEAGLDARSLCWMPDAAAAAEGLAARLQPGDTLFLKGSRAMGLERIAAALASEGRQP